MRKIFILFGLPLFYLLGIILFFIFLVLPEEVSAILEPLYIPFALMHMPAARIFVPRSTSLDQVFLVNLVFYVIVNLLIGIPVLLLLKKMKRIS